MENIQKTQQWTKTKPNNVTCRKTKWRPQASQRKKQQKSRRASKYMNWQFKRQTVQHIVNKQEHILQFSPSQPNAGRSVWSQTQPIPFSRAKASGTMVTVTMWSISIPEDSSVREVEQTVASISHYHVHISKLLYTQRPATPWTHTTDTSNNTNFDNPDLIWVNASV